MANNGSPNPSAIIVNLSEDTRQSDPEKLKVTAFPAGSSEGMLAFPGDETAAAGEAAEVVERTVPEKTLFRLKGFDGYGDVDGLWELKVDGQVVAYGATSAAVRLAEKTFDPPFRVEEDKVVLLTVTNQGSVEGAFKGVLRGWDEPA